jgi:hypothetical protein
MTEAPPLSPFQGEMVHHLHTHPRLGIIVKFDMGLGVSYAIASALGQVFDDGEEPNVLVIAPAVLQGYWKTTLELFDVPMEKVTLVSPQKIVGKRGFEFAPHLTGNHRWIVDFNCLTSPRVRQLTLPAIQLSHHVWGEVMFHPGHPGWEFANNISRHAELRQKNQQKGVMFPATWQMHADALKAESGIL